jgi:hypothetical protein
MPPPHIGSLSNIQHPCVFFGEFLQKLRPENVISTNAKDFSWEKWSKFAKFQKIKKFKLPDFYNKFQ